MDVAAIPEKGGDDPFGLIDKQSNNDSFGMTAKTNKSTLQKKKEKQELKLRTKDLEKNIKMREYVGP